MNGRFDLGGLLRSFGGIRGLVWGFIIFGSLIAFEAFNFASSQFAFRDFLGSMAAGPFLWATILAFAYSALDFAGIARLFTPSEDSGNPWEKVYLAVAWFLSATVNAFLTWWGVSVAIVNKSVQGAVIFPEGQAFVLRVVPIFVAAIIVVIRIFLIKSLTTGGGRMFTTGEKRTRH